MADWTVKDSLELYAVPHWGCGFYGIDEKGDVVVHPEGPGHGTIDLPSLARQLVAQGVELPILFRFSDIVSKRVETLVEVFRDTIREHEFQGRYRGVYPIKVNQQRHLVEEIVRFCRPFHVGLEVGSKPELLLGMAVLSDPEALLICNGYKDPEFIQTAFKAQKLGRNPIIVIEKLSEVDAILEAARLLEVEPKIGVRVKLSRPGKGRWWTSAGDAAKFGLSLRDVAVLVETLRASNMLNCLRMLHFHIGSQVTAIRTIKDALTEACRTYVELVRMGAPMGLFDVGGGLGVDYDGSRTNFESSMNYTEREYAADVVYAIQTACDVAGVPHPDIVTESGRAMVAHHSVLVFEVLGVEGQPTEGPPLEVSEDAPYPLHDMREVYDGINSRSYQEAWHDALHYREEGLMAYNLGLLNLEQRAMLEHLFWQVCGRIRLVAKRQSYVPDDFEELERKVADRYYCNFSVFQSAPDAWAIGQLFPIMPLHRLAEKPTRHGILGDLTCDSDGKIDRFIDRRDVKEVLELHPWNGEPYLLGLFLAGAYQEILGDLHNLFGDTNAVHVSLDGNGGFSVDQVIRGERVAEVLDYVQYDKDELIGMVREACGRGIGAGTLDEEEAAKLLAAYRRGLDTYTYLGGRLGATAGESK